MFISCVFKLKIVKTLKYSFIIKTTVSIFLFLFKSVCCIHVDLIDPSDALGVQK